MALETKNGGGNTTYLSLDYGKKQLYINSKEEKEGFEKHVNTKGNISYRQPVGAVSGRITAAYFKDTDFGKQFTLSLEDEGEKYSVSLGIDSAVFMNIARSINNVDVSKKVRLAVYPNPSKKSDKVYFGTSLSYPEVVGEDGKTKLVEWGEELPQGKQLKTGKWDFSAQEDEAYGRVEEFISKNGFDNFESNNSNAQSEFAPKEQTEKDKNNSSPFASDDSQDLPF